MLTSLFGDLGLTRASQADLVSRPPGTAPSDAPFAARALVESTSAELGDSGRIVDRHVRDLFVSGSPAQAMRAHFAAMPPGDGATHEFTLFDPAQIWARSVVKTLSDVSGQPVERLNLRDHIGLRTLGAIERTAIHRRGETLKIYHVDLAPAAQVGYEIPLALMERCDLAAVIIGPLPPHAIDSILDNLRAAVAAPTWRCPALVFLLPPGAVWMANKVLGIEWPERIRIQVLNEPMTGASAVWNSLLDVWTELKVVRAKPHDAEATSPGGLAGRPADTSALRAPDPPAGRRRAAPSSGDAALVRPAQGSIAIDGRAAKRALAELLSTDGVLGCVLVEIATDTVVARERAGGAEIDLDAAAAACGPILRAHRIVNRSMGLTDRLDELSVLGANRLQIVRAIPQRPGYVLMALFDVRRVRPAVASLRLAETAKTLG
jgi:hypothetical protein